MMFFLKNTKVKINKKKEEGEKIIKFYINIE